MRRYTYIHLRPCRLQVSFPELSWTKPSSSHTRLTCTQRRPLHIRATRASTSVDTARMSHTHADRVSVRWRQVNGCALQQYHQPQRRSTPGPLPLDHPLACLCSQPMPTLQTDSSSGQTSMAQSKDEHPDRRIKAPSRPRKHTTAKEKRGTIAAPVCLFPRPPRPKKRLVVLRRDERSCSDEKAYKPRRPPPPSTRS